MVESQKPRRASAYQRLGSGSVADILLWRKWAGSIMMLMSATSFWLLFKRGEYNLLSFLVDVIFFLIIVLFFWAKSATILNRPMPPVPDMEILDASADKAAEVARVWINRTLSIAREIAVCGNLSVLLQVAITMWIISMIGALFDFVNFVYIGVLLCLSLPVVYEKFQGPLDELLFLLGKIVRVQWRKFDRKLLSKIPIPKNKRKKAQ